MKKLFSIIFAALVVSVSFAGVSTPAFAEDPATTSTTTSNICDIVNGVPQEVKDAAGCTKTDDQLPNVIQAILTSIIGITGTIAVVFIVIGGINYITSNGDAGKLKKAKDTILYACIGLVISALAFAIVNWVISILS